MAKRPVPGESRRALLKLLGVAGSVAVGSATLENVRAEMPESQPTESLARAGQSLRDELGGSLDAQTLESNAATFAEAAGHLNSIADAGVPGTQRGDFEPVASAGRPIVSHLADAAFYERATDALPGFTTGFIEESVARFANEAVLASPLEELGFEDGDGVDLLGTVVADSTALTDRHWIATDGIPRDVIGYGEYVPTMTRGAHEGSLLWLQDLDSYLWQNAVLVTDEVYRDAVWYARAMAAGFHLVTAGAIDVAADRGTYTDEQLAALLSVGFSIQTICDPSILQDVYWLTDADRGPRRDDLERAEVDWR